MQTCAQCLCLGSARLGQQQYCLRVEWYLEVSMGVPAMEASGVRGVTGLLRRGGKTGGREELDTQRRPTLA